MTLREIVAGLAGVESRLHQLVAALSALQEDGPIVEPDPKPEIVRPQAWAARLTQRGVVWGHQGAHRYDLAATYYEGDAAQGRHHILVDVLDAAGLRIVGAQVWVRWPDGAAPMLTEAKPGEAWAAAYPMFAAGHAYTLEFGGWSIGGMGLGTIAEPQMGHHVSYGFVFRARAAQG